MNMLTENEQMFLNHMIRWGSDGYPVQKVGRQWKWIVFYGCHVMATTYKTKKAAVAAIEAYITLLCDRKAGRR
jgi:hypothetical protein